MTSPRDPRRVRRRATTHNVQRRAVEAEGRASVPAQQSMFDPVPVWPDGFRYQPDFLTVEDEVRLLQRFEALPFEHATYHQWTAKRRIVSYGGRYDFARQELNPGEPIPAFLRPLREDVARWAGVPPDDLGHVTIAEYPPGTQLGWHRDVPQFEVVTGVSLSGTARMRFRPYPPTADSGRATASRELAPRSAYVIAASSRWRFQHAISPTPSLRYSITFRTLRAGG